MRVQHGASPPADGTLVNVQGEFASFDESSLTGESRLVKKQVGDSLFVGTINRGAVVDIRVDAIGGETMYVFLLSSARDNLTDAYKGSTTSSKLCARARQRERRLNVLQTSSLVTSCPWSHSSR